MVLTTFAEDENVYAALRAGAIGFLVKDDEPEAMIDTVRRAVRGDLWLAPDVLRRVVARAVAADEGPARPPDPGLTPREREVLALLGTGLSNAEIGAALHIGVTTVKTHIGAAMERLELRNRVQAAVAAHRLGLVDPDHCAPSC
ncbi:LuxR C-terminal-related transcriptional regulator [Spirillospora sp. CA-255316]